MPFKRLSLLAFSLFMVSSFVVLATRHSNGESTLSGTEQRIKVLRRKGQLHLKPTLSEVAAFKKTIQKEERELEDQLPKHLPIKVKIKAEKEKGFKDLKNEGWARDFILEVTNTGEKPIYFLSLNLFTDVKMASGKFLVFGLAFGQIELGDIRVKAQPNDVSIKPGEIYEFAIHPGQLEAWELLNRKENHPQPKKLRARFGLMSFGDGTGFAGSDGQALPRKLSERSSLDKCADPLDRAGPLPLDWASLSDRWASKLTLTDFAGELLAGKFFYLRPAQGFLFSSSAVPPSCCPGEGCTPLIVSTVSWCVNWPPVQRVTATNCGDSQGGCWAADYSGELPCSTGAGNTYICQIIDTTPCGVPPAPTPSPTPTPSPSPTPETCDPATRPNPTNCTCEQLPGIGFLWQCGCGQVEPADYVRYPQSSGCDPSKQANNGSNCCVCIAQNVPCDPGYTRNTYSCECVQNPLQTPTPPNEGGGNGENQNAPCTTYYWVLYDCQPVGESGWSCTQVAMWEAGCF